MKGCLSLALLAALLCSACATPHYAETDVLASKILLRPPNDSVCRIGEVRLRVIEGDGSQRSHCLEYRTEFGGATW